MKNKIICHDIKGAETEVEASQLIFRPSVYGILINDGKVLLSKQWDGYGLPGGGVKIDERVEEALKREFFEETGLKIKLKKPVHCETNFFAPPFEKGQYWNSVLMYFLVEKVSGEISIDQCDDDEKTYIDLPEWIEIEKVKDLKFYNSIDNDKVIKKALVMNNK